MKAAEAFAAATLRAGFGEGDAAHPAALADAKAAGKGVELSSPVGACCTWLSKRADRAHAGCLWLRLRALPCTWLPVRDAVLILVRSTLVSGVAQYHARLKRVLRR